MAAPERRVRHLRLRAHSADAVRHVLPALEDALRCASLPDSDGRVLLVRRLALGRLPREVNAQALAQRIEQRVAQTPVQWVQGGTAAAATATHVAFAGALQARTQLALRLAAGQDCREWYWPLAVPEWREAAGPADALRRMARQIAAWPEARLALPAWVAALVRAGAAAPLAAAIDALEGEALLQQAGIPLPRSEPEPARARVREAANTPVDIIGLPRRGAPDAPRVAPMPRWLRGLWPASLPADIAAPRQPAGAARPASASQPQRQAVPAPQIVARAAAPGGLTAPLEASPDTARPTLRPWPGPAAPRVAQPLQAGAPGPSATARPPTPHTAANDNAATPNTVCGALRQHRFDAIAPTDFAGLLFLLPVLQGLGLAAWLQPPDDGAFARCVLHAALRRLRAPAEDAAWQLVQALPPGAAARALPAPGGWSDPRLAAPRGGPAPAAALAACTQAEQQAQVWLDVARRWLRRAGRIGLASLVRRPGALRLTATHVDLHFRLDDTDLRVRRLGLDIDPGWLPWFGRVVGFHYERDDP